MKFLPFLKYTNLYKKKKNVNTVKGRYYNDFEIFTRNTQLYKRNCIHSKLSDPSRICKRISSNVIFFNTFF